MKEKQSSLANELFSAIEAALNEFEKDDPPNTTGLEILRKALEKRP